MKPFDVFQPGLHRGSAHLPHDPVKAYAFVEHPTEGWRVYLRSCLFLHAIGPWNSQQFLVVKRRGAHASSATWEPPKGQMEGKDLHANRSILQNLTENVLRETEEESHVTKVARLRHRARLSIPRIQLSTQSLLSISHLSRHCHSRTNQTVL